MIRKALMVAGSFALAYLVFAFVGMEVNPARWRVDARFFMVVLGAALAAFAALVGAACKSSGGHDGRGKKHG